MQDILERIRWSVLLALFKIRRAANMILASRALDYRKKTLRILTANIREYETRAQSADKEPETVAWLECHAKAGDVFYDVGANIGAYSLIAAALGMRVYSFEPNPENYATLQKNVFMNRYVGTVIPLPFVLGSQNSLSAFDAPATSGASASFASSDRQSGAASVTMPVLPLDTCVGVFLLPTPTVMKVDVDGAELDVLRGASKTLAAPQLQSILIEVSDDTWKDVEKLLLLNGFRRMEAHPRSPGFTNLIFEKHEIS